MSDKDLIRRGEVEDILCNACDGTIDEGALAYLISELKKIPAVPHEMTAREYLKTMRPICEDGRNCGKCPLSYNNNGAGINCQDYAAYYPEEAVATVEKWAREHLEERSEDNG